MASALDISISSVERSRLPDMDMNNIPFGHYFTDHMLEVDYQDGKWQKPLIRPYQPLLMDPSTAALHYGQAIFEGIKAYKDGEGNPFIFRPHDNYRRFNISAERMCMPQVPEDLFIEGMRRLVGMDSAWIPQKDDFSLYIRPFMFSTDTYIGVKPSDTYKFMILLSPTGPYYAAPMRIYVEEFYVRAVPGGVGYVKAAGNYGAAMHATAEAKNQGYDQVLWTDATHHKYVQEIGTMNVFFIIGNRAITPDLNSGTILTGVTRDSVITMLDDEGIMVEERPISIEEIAHAYKAGTLKEVFGTGTAATVAPIKELRYKELIMEFKVEDWHYCPTIKSKLMAIRDGSAPDIHDWMFKV
jgi:branched-chain amino acid aminotransferase